MLRNDERNSSIGEARFNELLLEVIDDRLTRLLGEEAKKTLYIYLKAVLFLERENIGRELKLFHKGLKLLFGSSAIEMEDVIVKGLLSRLGLKISGKDTFVNFVEKAKTFLIVHEMKIR